MEMEGGSGPQYLVAVKEQHAVGFVIRMFNLGNFVSDSTDELEQPQTPGMIPKTLAVSDSGKYTLV